jgi:hypothetical protein
MGIQPTLNLNAHVLRSLERLLTDWGKSVFGISQHRNTMPWRSTWYNYVTIYSVQTYNDITDINDIINRLKNTICAAYASVPLSTAVIDFKIELCIDNNIGMTNGCLVITTWLRRT